MILAHNHPSGDHKFSEDDVLTTSKLLEALATVEVILLDHILVGLAPNGKVWLESMRGKHFGEVFA